MTHHNTTADRRRQLAADLLLSMAALTYEAQAATLRRLADECLSITPVHGPQFPVHIAGLGISTAGHVLAQMANEPETVITVACFDISGIPSSNHRPVDYATIQQARAAVPPRYHASGQHTAILIFILPEGTQFVYAVPAPGQMTWLSLLQTQPAWPDEPIAPTPGPTAMPMFLRRLTYRWNDPNRTTLDALASIGQSIHAGTRPGTALQRGFSVQPVTEDFFQRYKSAYRAAAASFLPQLNQPEAETAAQTLLNRLLFVHFISKKGWLAFNGSHDYLNALWDDYQAHTEQDNFHSHRLAPLFHHGLSRPLSSRYAGIDATIGQTPYLNSGLFKPNALDAAEIRTDDKIIATLLGPEGLFNRYNFTVSESTPLDTEVAVDPEMLGKIFEETVNERHQNGAYYTPRPVVAFMCREALKGYVDGQQIPGLTQTCIAELIDDSNCDRINPDQAAGIAQSLREVKILDPACGSGAFLLGMMQAIIAVKDSLSTARQTPQERYRQKVDIISQNLYGTDKDETAVRTAMLRLWLSMAVDYEGTDTPPTLPNLDLKLAVGDALNGPNPEHSQDDITAEPVSDSHLASLTESYTYEPDPDQQNYLRQQIDQAKATIRARYPQTVPADAIDWRTAFAYVNRRGGFDIVITNPPYVRHEQIGTKRQKRDLLKAYPDAAAGRSDLYCYFYARAMQLLKPGGMHVFVCSNSWLDVGYGAKLQQYLLQHSSILAIYESAVERQFSTAAINTVITVARKGTPDPAHPIRFVQLLDEFENATRDPEQQRVTVKTVHELLTAGSGDTPRPAASQRKRRNGYHGDRWGGKYLRAPDIYHHIMEQHAHQLAPLSQIANLRRGVTTGSNEFFLLDVAGPERHHIDPQFLTPIMTTPRESRSIAVNAGKLPYLLFNCQLDQDAITDAGARRYIAHGRRRAVHLQQTAASRRNWYSVGKTRPAKLLLNKMVDTTSRTFLVTPAVVANNVFYCIDVPDCLTIPLCAALNSALGQLMVNVLGRANFGGGMLELAARDAARLPVVKPEFMPRIDPEIFHDAEWSALRPTVRQSRMDAAISEAIGLTAAELDQIHVAVSHLVTARRQKAARMLP